MKESDLGIYDGQHDERLTLVERAALEILEDRGKGAEAAISAREFALAMSEGSNDEFVWRLAGRAVQFDAEQSKRDVRKLVNHLIMTHGIPIICQAGTGGGYYIAGCEAEVTKFYTTFHRRAMTGLVKASRGKKSAFVDIATQLVLGFDSQETKEAVERLQLTPDGDSVPAWVSMVTQFLDRLSGNPEKYAAEIRRIQEQYGDIFVPAEKVRRLREETAKFQQLLLEIA